LELIEPTRSPSKTKQHVVSVEFGPFPVIYVYQFEVLSICKYLHLLCISVI